MGGVEDRRVLHPQTGQVGRRRRTGGTSARRRRAARRPARSAAGRAPRRGCRRRCRRRSGSGARGSAARRRRAAGRPGRRRRRPAPAAAAGPRSQSMSNQSAYAESRPRRSTSHQAGLAAGTATPAWLGTMSTTRPEPGRRAARATSRRRAGLAAELRVDRPVVDHVVAVRGAGRGGQQRRAVEVADAEVGEVVGERGGGVQVEAGPDLHPVGRPRAGGRHVRPSSPAPRSERSGTPTVPPALDHRGVCSGSGSAVLDHQLPLLRRTRSPGMVKSSGASWALKQSRNESSTVPLAVLAALRGCRRR